MAREIGMTFTLNGALGGGFRAAFRGAKGQIEGISQAIRSMERSPTGKLGAAMAQQKAKIKELGTSLRDAKARLGELQSRATAAGGASGMLARQISLAERQVSGLSSQFQRLSGHYRNTVAETRTAAGSVRALSQEYRALSASMDKASARRAKLAGIQQQRADLRSQRSDLKGQFVSAAASALTVAAPAKIAVDFEDAMARVGAVANASEADMARLTATARQLGRDTMFSASQAAEGMKYLAMAGFDANETIAAMPGMLDLAAAGNTDLGRTADIASDILTAFKMKAEDMGIVSDTLAKGFTTSNTSLEMLGETMKYVGPVAASVGMSLQDTTAMAGLMANTGIKASQGGTVLRAALLRLSAPPKMAKDALGELAGVAGEELDELYDMVGDNSGALDALQEIGMTTKDASGNLRPMADILEELNARTAQMGSAEKAEVFKKVFGAEAAAGMIALAEQAGATVDKYGNKIVDSLGRPTNALRAYMEKINDYHGTTQRIAQKMNATTAGALRRLKSAWEDVGISVGNLFLPAISGAADALSGVGNFISKLVQDFPTLSKAVALTVAGLATLSVGSFAVRLGLLSMRSGLLSARSAFLWTGGAAKALGGSLMGLSQSFAKTAVGARLAAMGIKGALISTGIGAVVVALGIAADYIYTHWDEICTAISDAFDTLQDVFAGVVTFFENVGPAILGRLEEHIPGISDIFSDAADWVQESWAQVSAFFSGLWDNICAGASTASQWFSDVWSGATDYFTSLWSGVEGAASSAWEGIAAVWAPVGEFFGGIVDGIRDIFTGFFDWLAGKFQWVLDAVGWIKGVVGAVTGGVSEAFDKGAAEAGKRSGARKYERLEAERATRAARRAEASSSSATTPPAPGQRPGFTPVKYQPEPKKQKGGSRKRSGGGGGGGRGGGSLRASGGSSGGGGTTIVRLAGDNRSFTTQYIPAGGGAAPLPISGTGTPAASGGRQGISGASAPVAASRGSTPSAASAMSVVAAKPLPVIVQNLADFAAGAYLPGNIDVPWLRKSSAPSLGGAGGVQVSLHQTFNVGGANVDAIQRRLSAMGPDFENMVRRALSDIGAQDRRVVYGQ